MINLNIFSLKYLTTLATLCSSKSNFLSFPTWYEFLNCNPNPTITGINDVWLIVAAIVDILLRIAAILAVGFIIYGGIKYITSQGNPDQTNSARNLILSAVIGLIVTIVASVVVTFIAGAIK